MTDPRSTDSSPPLFIVAGMHRSGTSMTGGLLAALGVNMGDRLVPADRSNPRGYFEDLDFLELNRRLLAACVPAGEPGWPDWGWTESESWREPDPARWREPALRLLEARRAAGVPWGWKDPRSTRLLEFWAGLAPEARFVLVYRYPWEVADSMQRLRDGIFRAKPGFAHPIWRRYNRDLLAFKRRYPERCLLVSANVLATEPERFPEALAAAFPANWPKVDLTKKVGAEELVSRSGPDPLVDLLAATHPQSLELLRELDAEADLSAAGRWGGAGAARFTRAATVAVEPEYSIVVPCFDHGEFLVEAIASVERHAPAGGELLIVDDGSREPRTVEILGRLAGSGYAVVRQANAGLPAARNAAIALARGEFILPLDADNRLRPGYVENALAILRARPAVGVVYADAWEFGRDHGRRTVPEFEVAAHLLAPTIDACAVFRRRAWLESGGYDVGLKAWEDWEFWIRLSRMGWGFARWDGIGFDYRVREGSMVHGGESAAVRRARLRHIHRRHAEFIRRHHPELGRESAYVRVALARIEGRESPALRLKRLFGRPAGDLPRALLGAVRRRLRGRFL
jgi:GT2 family glycosyltransferase